MITIINAAILLLLVVLVLVLMLVAAVFYKHHNVVKIIADFVSGITIGIAIPVSITLIQDNTNNPDKIVTGLFILVGFLVVMLFSMILKARNEDNVKPMHDVKNINRNNLYLTTKDKEVNDSVIYVNYKSIWPWKSVKVLCKNNDSHNLKIGIPIKRDKNQRTLLISYNSKSDKVSLKQDSNASEK